MVDRKHLESAGNVCFDDEDMIPLLQKWAAAGRKNGTHIWVQISHSGRQTSRFNNSRPFAPSQVQLKRFALFGTPKEMSEQDILEVVDGFVRAASIAKAAGFTGVQIHSAHGYLLSEFLSPVTNRRQDKWGGSIHNRCRLLLTIIEETRSAVGSDYPISVKLNSSDFQKGGLTEQESLQVVELLYKAGVDLLEVSGGTYEQSVFLLMNARASTRKREAYFIEFARKVRDKCRIPLMVTGGFRTHAFCQEVLTNDEVDFIGMARPFIASVEKISGFLKGDVQRVDDPVIRTGIPILENAAEGGFHARQLIRLSQGKDYNAGMSGLSSAIFLVTYEFMKSLKRRKG